MSERKYQTIDPLIMETLNLNQKRIHHIFDILHGRDMRPETDRINRTATINSNISSRLPRLTVQQQRVKSPRLQQQPNPKAKRQRNFSASVLSNTQNPQLQNIEQYSIQKKPAPRSSRPSHSSRPSQEHTISVLSKPLQFSQQASIQDRRERLMQDYGMHKIRNSKSMEINPKDVYRIQIESLVSRCLEIDELQDAEKLMRRLKRRYQHLRKFDKGYYSRLCANQIALL